MEKGKSWFGFAPKAREVLFAPLAMYPPGGRPVRLPYRQ
jgi:hypothetical protein